MRRLLRMANHIMRRMRRSPTSPQRPKTIPDATLLSKKLLELAPALSGKEEVVWAAGPVTVLLSMTTDTPVVVGVKLELVLAFPLVALAEAVSTTITGVADVVEAALVDVAVGAEVDLK